ncbi:hypothetical protein [Sulfurovum sp.]|uniref:hypothetical protein n=1 Tax=Sulfurovum sp. TaxID=1969726 RepID=UPI0035623E0A
MAKIINVKVIPFLSILIVLLYALYNAQFRDPLKVDSKKHKHYKEHIKTHKVLHYKDELSQINTDEYTKQYIIQVINHGSTGLGFKGGVMEGGFANPEDAEKIACYTMTLSGRQCSTPYAEDAPMFYTSICGGCHGNDGTGLGGSYPDLTKAKMLGIEAREMFLRSMQKNH